MIIIFKMEDFYDQASTIVEESTVGIDSLAETMFDTDINNEELFGGQAPKVNNSRVNRIMKRIDSCKMFYTPQNKDVHFKYSISLKSVPNSYYLKHKNETWVCEPYKDIFRNENDLVVLLVQLVNEKQEMKFQGKIAFQADMILRVKDNSVFKTQFHSLCFGTDREEYLKSQKLIYEKAKWLFVMHKRRLFYIYQLIVKIDNCFLNDHLKNTNTYDDVFNYCLKNDKVYKDD